MVTPQPASPSPSAEGQPSIAARLGWWLKGFLWPCFSRTYYAQATTKRLSAAILFLFVFAIPQTLATDLVAGTGLRGLQRALEGAYDQFDLPKVTIADGVAVADPTAPFEAVVDDTLIAIDTTGAMEQIDRSRYEQGLLFTETAFHFLPKDGQYYVAEYAHLQRAFDGPIVLSREMASELLYQQAKTMTPMGRLGIYGYNTVVRLALLLLIGLGIWIGIRVKRQGFPYRVVLIIGILANVPTWYLTFVLQKVGWWFSGAYLLFWLITWGIAFWTVPKQVEAYRDAVEAT